MTRGLMKFRLPQTKLFIKKQYTLFQNTRRNTMLPGKAMYSSKTDVSIAITSLFVYTVSSALATPTWRQQLVN